MNKLSFMQNKKILLPIFGVLLVMLIFIFAFSSKTVNESCDWCGNKPSVEYELKDGGASYVCKDCSKKCAWCDKKAVKHYENIAEIMVFVCNDCYEDIDD